MHRCFVSPAAWDARHVRLSSEEAHHLLHVLRAVPGDVVTVFDGQGRQALARLPALPLVPRPSLGLEIMESVPAERPAVFVPRAPALPKGPKMDWIVEKATELGVSVVLPVITERVVTRLRDSQKEERRERWQRIALSAAKQCCTSWVPEVRAVSGFAEAVKRCAEADLFLVGALTPEARAFRTVLREAGKNRPRQVALLIGPEGDLTPDELAEACRAGAVPVSFGPRVLRVDTAALFGLSVLASELATTA